MRREKDDEAPHWHAHSSSFQQLANSTHMSLLLLLPIPQALKKVPLLRDMDPAVLCGGVVWCMS